jgi:outer membrane autotransporter protein
MSKKTQFAARGILVAAMATLAGFCLSSTATAQQNLVQNPGFETGNFDDWITIPAATGSDLHVFTGPDGGHPHSGIYFAGFGATQGLDDAILQNIQTMKGARYSLSFWVASNFANGQFQALWNGSVVYNTNAMGLAPYVQIVVNNLVATSVLSVLTFQGETPPGFYDLDDISLTLDQVAFKTFALTPNQFAVASNLDRVVGDPRATNLIAFLNNEPLANLPRDFDLISPDSLTAIFEISRSFAEVQDANIENRLADVRAANTQPDSGTTVALAVSDGKSTVGLRDDDKKAVAPITPETKRWNLWMEGNGDFVRVDGDGNGSGYNFDTGGVTFGGDYRVCDHFVVGLMAGYANTGATLTQGGSVDVNSGRVGIYSTTFGDGLYLNTLADGGYNSYDTHRLGLGGIAQGNTDGEEFDGMIGGGYDMHSGHFTVGPVVSAQYTYVSLNSFNEMGSLAPLYITSQSQDSLTSKVGFKVSSAWNVGGVTVTPSVTAGWQHEYLDSSFALDSQFASGAGNVFTVNGPKLGRDGVVVNAGVSVQWTERLGTYLFYDGELGRKNYELNSVTGGVKLGF